MDVCKVDKSVIRDLLEMSFSKRSTSGKLQMLKVRRTYHSLIITQPTNALIVCHLFLNHFF